MKLVFMGAQTAGLVGLLSALASGHTVLEVVTKDVALDDVASAWGIPVLPSIIGSGLADADLLLSVHGREVVLDRLLALPKLGGVNVHPNLYKYKGANPVGRALAEGESRWSVGAHRMTNVVDEGEVLVEEFINMTAVSMENAYRHLYPLYATVVRKSLELA